MKNHLLVIVLALGCAACFHFSGVVERELPPLIKARGDAIMRSICDPDASKQSGTPHNFEGDDPRESSSKFLYRDSEQHFREAEALAASIRMHLALSKGLFIFGLILLGLIALVVVGPLVGRALTALGITPKPEPQSDAQDVETQTGGAGKTTKAEPRKTTHEAQR